MEDLEAGASARNNLAPQSPTTYAVSSGQEPRAAGVYASPELDGPEHFEEVGGAGQLEGDMVTGTEAGGMQRPGDAVGLLGRAPDTS